MENARNAIKSIDQALQENPSMPPEERKKYEERKAQFHKQYTDAISFANLVRKQYASGGTQKTAQAGAAAANAANAPRPQTSGVQAVGQPGQAVGSGPPASAPANSMQSSTAAVNAAIEAAKKQQLAAGRLPGAVNALPAQQGSQAHPHQPQQAPAPGSMAHAQTSTPQAHPAQVAASQQQQAQAQQAQQHQQQPQVQQQAAPIKIEPGTQPLPTPLNTAMAAAAGGMQLGGTPTQNSARIQTPQSATPTTTNANIRPLTHAAAMNLAASQQRVNMNPMAAAPGHAPAPATALGVMGAAQQPGHPHAHPPQHVPPPQNPPQPKLPIPKVLPEKATQIPTPVPNIGGVGSGRPTYSNGGVMNQPALPKIPAYQLEGEGERILNKKKLDELVRQVCGGTAEGQDGNLLTPEVEEVRQTSSFFCLLWF